MRKFLNEVQTVATLLWSSNAELAGREFCSILNEVIRRDDDETLLPHTVVIVRAINQLVLPRKQ